MAVTGGIMVPHPPLIIPQVGRGREKEIQATIDAYHKAAEKLASWKPDTVVVLSPHSMMYMDYFHISPGEEAEGDFGQFGVPQVKIKVQYDTEFVTLLTREAEERKIPAGTLGEKTAAGPRDDDTFVVFEPLLYRLQSCADRSFRTGLFQSLHSGPVHSENRRALRQEDRSDRQRRSVP